jgi:hypothetical protein
MREPHARITNRIDLQVELSYEVVGPGADFVFNIHAARTPSQTLRAEQLVLSQALEPQPQAYTDPISGNRYLPAAPCRARCTEGVVCRLRGSDASP